MSLQCVFVSVCVCVSGPEYPSDFLYKYIYINHRFPNNAESLLWSLPDSLPPSLVTPSLLCIRAALIKSQSKGQPLLGNGDIASL